MSTQHPGPQPVDPASLPDPEDITEADPDERARMGKTGQERVNGRLSWRNSQQALLAAYAAACRDRTAVPSRARGAAGITSKIAAGITAGRRPRR